jgi:hypothetical protein
MRGVSVEGGNTSRGLASAAVICGVAGILTVGVGAAVGVIAGVMAIARARRERSEVVYPWLATAFTAGVAVAWPLVIDAYLWDRHRHPGAGGEIPAPTSTELLTIPAIQLTAALLTLLAVKLIERERNWRGDPPPCASRRAPRRSGDGARTRRQRAA